MKHLEIIFFKEIGLLEENSTKFLFIKPDPGLIILQFGASWFRMVEQYFSLFSIQLRKQSSILHLINKTSLWRYQKWKSEPKTK